jgi:hypothetical protein
LRSTLSIHIMISLHAQYNHVKMDMCREAFYATPVIPGVCLSW